MKEPRQILCIEKSKIQEKKKKRQENTTLLKAIPVQTDNLIIKIPIYNPFLAHTYSVSDINQPKMTSLS